MPDASVPLDLRFALKLKDFPTAASPGDGCAVAISQSMSTIVHSQDQTVSVYSTRYQGCRSFTVASRSESDESGSGVVTAVACVTLVRDDGGCRVEDDFVLAGTSTGRLVIATSGAVVFHVSQFHDQPLTEVAPRIFNTDCAMNPSLFRVVHADQIPTIEEVMLFYIDGTAVSLSGASVRELLTSCRGLFPGTVLPELSLPPKQAGAPRSSASMQVGQTPHTLQHRHFKVAHRGSKSATVGKVLCGACVTRVQPAALDVFDSATQNDRVYVVGGSSPGVAAVSVSSRPDPISAAKIAQEVASKALNLVKGWWGSSSSGADDTPPDVAKLQSNLGIFLDSAEHYVTSLVADPTQRVAAVVDTAARLHVLDLHSFSTILTLKGARDAECTWVKKFVPSGNPGVPGRRQLFLVVHLPARGIVEVYSMRRGLGSLRVAAGTVGECARLFQTATAVGTRREEALAVILKKDGSLYTVDFTPPSREAAAPQTKVSTGQQVRYSQQRMTTIEASITGLETTKDFAKFIRDKLPPSARFADNWPIESIMALHNLALERLSALMGDARSTANAALPQGVEEFFIGKNDVDEKALQSLTWAQLKNYLRNRLFCVKAYRDLCTVTAADLMSGNERTAEDSELAAKWKKELLRMASGLKAESDEPQEEDCTLRVVSSLHATLNAPAEEQLSQAESQAFADQAAEVARCLTASEFTSLFRCGKGTSVRFLDLEDRVKSLVDQCTTVDGARQAALDFLRRTVRTLFNHSLVTRSEVHDSSAGGAGPEERAVQWATLSNLGILRSSSPLYLLWVATLPSLSFASTRVDAGILVKTVHGFHESTVQKDRSAELLLPFIHHIFAVSSPTDLELPVTVTGNLALFSRSEEGASPSLALFKHLCALYTAMNVKAVCPVIAPSQAEPHKTLKGALESVKQVISVCEDAGVADLSRTQLSGSIDAEVHGSYLYLLAAAVLPVPKPENETAKKGRLPSDYADRVRHTFAAFQRDGALDSLAVGHSFLRLTLVTRLMCLMSPKIVQRPSTLRELEIHDAALEFIVSLTTLPDGCGRQVSSDPTGSDDDDVEDEEVPQPPQPPPDTNPYWCCELLFHLWRSTFCFSNLNAVLEAVVLQYDGLAIDASNLTKKLGRPYTTKYLRKLLNQVTAVARELEALLGDDMPCSESRTLTHLLQRLEAAEEQAEGILRSLDARVLKHFQDHVVLLLPSGWQDAHTTKKLDSDTPASSTKAASQPKADLGPACGCLVHRIRTTIEDVLSFCDVLAVLLWDMPHHDSEESRKAPAAKVPPWYDMYGVDALQLICQAHVPVPSKTDGTMDSRMVSRFEFLTLVVEERLGVTKGLVGDSGRVGEAPPASDLLRRALRIEALDAVLVTQLRKQLLKNDDEAAMNTASSIGDRWRMQEAVLQEIHRRLHVVLQHYKELELKFKREGSKKGRTQTSAKFLEILSNAPPHVSSWIKKQPHDRQTVTSVQESDLLGFLGRMQRLAVMVAAEARSLEADDCTPERQQLLKVGADLPQLLRSTMEMFP